MWKPRGPSGNKTSGDPDAKAWRETLKTIKWETDQVARIAAAIEEWHRKHPVQSLALRARLKKPPAELKRLQQTHAESIRFREGSHRRLAELEQAWPKKRTVYQQQLQREGVEIRTGQTFLGVIDAYPDRFRQLWKREDEAAKLEHRGREARRGRNRDDSRGWR